MMCTGSPIWSAPESPSVSAGRSAASRRSSARSRPDMPSPAMGGLYFAIVAGMRMPFESTTEIDGSSLTSVARQPGRVALFAISALSLSGASIGALRSGVTSSRRSRPPPSPWPSSCHPPCTRPRPRSPTKRPCSCRQAASHRPSSAEPGLPGREEPELPDRAEPELPDHAEPGLPDHAEPGLPDRAEPGLPDRAEPELPDHAEPGLPDRAEPGLPDRAEPGPLDRAEPELPDRA